MDTFMFMVFMLPFLYVFLKQEIFLKNRTFLKGIFFSSLLVFLGIVYCEISVSEKKWLVYFGAQTTLSFLLTYKMVASIWQFLFKRVPEISRAIDKFSDVIPTTLVGVGTILLPYAVELYLVQYCL